MKSPTKLGTVLAIGFTSLVLLRTPDPLRALPTPAQRFVEYYRALESSDTRVGPWQRVLFSLAMASSSSVRPGGAGASERLRSARTQPTTS